MSHPSPERLAALSDDTPTPIEAAHITTCDACTAELAAQRRLTRLAVAASGEYGLPSSRFDALAPRLRAEGLMQEIDRRAMAWRWTVRAAAAIGFIAVGAVAGRITGNAPVVGMNDVVFQGDGNVRGVAERTPVFKSQEDALQMLTASQQAYQNAAAFLAAQDTSQRFVGLNSDDYKTRLNALDEMAAASRAALYRAPQDPLLNQYYLAFQTAREQTLRQLQVALPTTRQLGRY